MSSLRPETGQPSAFERLGWPLAFIAATLAWLIPNHYPPWTSYYNEAGMGVALVALTLTVLPFRRSASVPRSVWFVVGVALLPWAQYAAGLLQYSGDAVVSSLYLVALAVSISVGYASIGPGGSRLALWLSAAALTAGTISAVFAVSHSLRLGSFGLWAEFTTPATRAVGNLAQPNNFATLLGLGALGVMYLYEQAKLQRVVAAALATLLVVAGALAQSRISLSFGIMVAAAIWLLARRGVSLRTPWVAVALLTVLHWVLMWSAPMLLQAFFDEGLETMASRNAGTPRTQMWWLLLDAVRLVPLQGYGWLQVGAAHLAVADLHPPGGGLWLQGHNVFIEFIVWCGWPLGLFLGGALLFWYASRIRRVRSLDAAVAMLVVSFVGVHALVELPQHYAYFLLPAGLWAGIAERDEGLRKIGGARWMMAPAVAALMAFVGIAAQYPDVEEDFRLVRFENSRIGDIRASQPAPDAPLLSALTSFLRFARTEPAPGLSEEQLRSMSEATKRYPYAPSLVRYASALALNGHPEEARRTFVKIRYIYGDKLYVRLKDALHEMVGQGQGNPGMAELDGLLPPAQSVP